MRLSSLLAVAVVIAAPVGARAASPQAVADSLIAADQAFGRQAAAHNLVDGVAAMLRPDAIMPTAQGGFSKGKDAVIATLKANPANSTATAQWAPVRAGVSGDGTHGFTLGFMTIHDAGKPDKRAKYLAYWIKGDDGWKVAAYKRAQSSEGAIATAVRPASLPARLVAAKADAKLLDAYRDSLAHTETSFSARSGEIGLGPAFVEFGSPDASNSGAGADFTFGNQAIGALVGQGDPKLRWAPDEGVIVAPSGDLGITFGYIHPAEAGADQASPFPFFTIWRRSSAREPWRYIAE